MSAKYGGMEIMLACRRCHRLSYASQNEIWDDRAARRANRIRARLGWRPGILHDEGGKPAGMHWRTFERLVAEHETFVKQALAGMAKHFGFRL